MTAFGNFRLLRWIDDWTMWSFNTQGALACRRRRTRPGH